MPRQNLHTLTIDKLVAGGFGLGRLANGMVVLVRYVLPGEKVLVQELERKKDYIYGTVREVLMPAPDRIEAPCPIYGRCGGCDLQHAASGAQLRLKKNILVDSLERSSGLFFFFFPWPVADPLAAPAHFNYRQRLRLQVDAGGNYGFFQPESHTVEPLLECLIAKELLNATLKKLQAQESFHDLLKHCNGFELLFNPDENDIILLLHFLRKPRPTDSLLAAELKNHIDNLAALLMLVKGHGLYDPVVRTFGGNPPALAYTSTIKARGTPLILSWEAGGFCQVNLEQNSRLIELVLEMVASGPHKSILDLYCGYGNFSLPAAQLAEEVIGFDAQNAAIRSGLRNARRLGIHNCSFAKKQVPDAVTDMLGAGHTFDTIILDPPRRGAPETVAKLPELGAEQIIYISCNPSTLARDLAVLSAADYRLARIVPVDMFPQTHHLEAVALLKRSGSVQ